MITLKQMRTIRILKEHLITLKREREVLATKLSLVDKEILILRETLNDIKSKVENENDS